MTDLGLSCPKSSSVSLSNRIRFIESRTSKLKQTLKAFTSKHESKRPPPFQNSRFSTSLVQNYPKSHYNSHKMLSQNDEEPRNRLSPSRTQKHEQIRVAKAQQYQQAKHKKLLMQRKIEQRREKEMEERRLLRWRVRAEREMGRTKLSEFEVNRLEGVARCRTGQGMIRLKGGELRRELMQQQSSSLGQFQEELSYRGELVRRIREAMLDAENEN